MNLIIQANKETQDQLLNSNTPHVVDGDDLIEFWLNVTENTIDFLYSYGYIGGSTFIDLMGGKYRNIIFKES